jgi:hypothetical protein
MKNFEDWFILLKSDEQWFELSSMHHKEETFRRIAFKVYMQEVADKIERPMSECRKHVYNIIAPMPSDKVRKDWVAIENEKIQKQEEEKKQKEWVPLTGEARMQKLKEWEAKIKEVEMQSAVPIITHKQAVEEGGWLPAKGPVHPVTTPMEAYIKDRRIAYIEYAYEPRTAEKKPGVVEEEEFNILYDEENLYKI